MSGYRSMLPTTASWESLKMKTEISVKKTLGIIKIELCPRIKVQLFFLTHNIFFMVILFVGTRLSKIVMHNILFLRRYYLSPFKTVVVLAIKRRADERRPHFNIRDRIQKFHRHWLIIVINFHLNYFEWNYSHDSHFHAISSTYFDRNYTLRVKSPPWESVESQENFFIREY